MTAGKASDELDAARRRIAELEAGDEEHRRATSVQRALYRVAETAAAASDLPSFYAAIHQIVGSLMYAENFYIALYDAERERMSYPYFADMVDTDRPDPAAWEPFGQGQARGVTAYALRHGEPLLIDAAEHERLVQAGEIDSLGVVEPDSTWIGVPLKAEGRTLGLLVVQTYTAEHRYTDEDRDLLAFVGQHVGSALARARAIEETRQRNAELALINEIGSALARQLEFQAIIDLVGARLISIFHAPTGFIALLDSTGEHVTYPYFVGPNGEQLELEPLPLGTGLASKLITSGQPLRLGTLAKIGAHSPVPGSERESESFLGVPIRAGERVIGAISVQAWTEDAFTEADERLMGTLASSMGVALENARLFDETKRLLTETDERNSELAVINEIGSALAKQLDFQAIVDLVGDRLRTILGANDLFIALLEPSRRGISFPYIVQGGERRQASNLELGAGLTSRVLEAKRPLRFGSLAEQMPLNPAISPGIDVHESWLGVPILVGENAIGIVNVSDHAPNAYTDADERLVATIASSMGVALENARLFDETKRLLSETDARAAELAIINSVQEGLAANLDMQAMYDLVGDRIREVFDAQVVTICLYDHDAETIRYVYAFERKARLAPFATPFNNLTREIISRQSRVVSTTWLPGSPNMASTASSTARRPGRACLYR